MALHVPEISGLYLEVVPRMQIFLILGVMTMKNAVRASLRAYTSVVYVTLNLQVNLRSSL